MWRFSIENSNWTAVNIQERNFPGSVDWPSARFNLILILILVSIYNK